MNVSDSSIHEQKEDNHDTLTLLILIVRKLQNVNSKQLMKALLGQIYDIFLENDGIYCLRSVLFEGISSVHSMCNQHFLQNIIDILPNQKSNKISNEKKQSLTLLTIPFNLRMLLLQYLTKYDLYQLIKTCHCLCVNAQIIIDLNDNILLDSEELNNNNINTLYQCNKSEVIKSIKGIINILKENNLLLKVLLNGMSCYHKKIGANILNEIINILPNENHLKINDSLTKSELITNDINNKDKKNELYEPLSLLNIPTDLKIYLFQYLNENEIYLLESMCRSLCIDARNPNSMTHIDILHIYKLNKYTQNHRYLKIKSLNIHCRWHKTLEIFKQRPNFRIYPLIKPFKELHEFRVCLETLIGTKHQFDNILNIIYYLLGNGATDKIFEIICESWNVADNLNILQQEIFNINHNGLAINAMNNIHVLKVSGFGIRPIAILRNMYSALNKNGNDKLLDSFQLKMRDWDPIQNWDWKLMRNISKKAKTVKFMTQFWISPMVFDTTMWNQWIVELNNCCKGFCDELSITIEINDCFLCRNGVRDFENHLNLWINSMNNIMMKIGMKCFEVEYKFSFLNQWENDDHMEQRRAWNELSQTLIPNIKHFCDQHVGATYILENDDDLTIIYCIEKQLTN